MVTSTETSILPTRKNLDAFKQTYLKKSSTLFTPDVELLEAPDGARFVMKDISMRPLWTRLLWCRQSMKREMEAYRKLTGLPGIPKFISQLDADGFVMEWIEAQPLPSRRDADSLGLAFFARLETLVGQMHERGVAHGDLRRQNILKSAEGAPFLIDFETAVRGRLFNLVAKIDQITVLKIRGKYFPASLTADEINRLQQAPWHLKTGRFIRKNIYGPLSGKKRKRRRE